MPVQNCGENVVLDLSITGHPVPRYSEMPTADAQMVSGVNSGLLRRGILKGGQKYCPTAVHTDQDVERTIEAFREIVPTLRG